jgi:DNA-binding response OmpR family regulator
MPIYLKAATGLGATASLEKPFAPDELLSLVEELLDAS